VRLSEKISGDSSFSHSLAFCRALEQLSEIAVPRRALYLRVIYAELERIANHCGDIGAIMLDTGFNFGGSHGARLREMVMRINERLTGSRFLRGANAIGGIAKDIDDKETKRLSDELAHMAEDFSEIVNVAENSASLLNRLKSTGVLSKEIALDHGALGIAAKALGISIDARVDFSYAAYAELGFERVETEQSGDVYARFCVRVKEVGASLAIIQRALKNLPQGAILALEKAISFKKNALAVSIVEGWRGNIVYFLTTDAKGNISRVAPRDPSSINWPLLEHAAVGNIVPDFPLINKSFNLSYSGNDL
jgi:Ni,Fe-hydrogenase III large subunit